MRYFLTTLFFISFQFVGLGQGDDTTGVELAKGIQLTKEEDKIFMENLDLALEYYQQAMDIINQVDDTVPLSQLIQNQETSAILLRKSLYHLNICRKYNPNHPFVYELYNGSEKTLKSTPDPEYVEQTD